jgi:hypothetical protein
LGVTDEIWTTAQTAEYLGIPARNVRKQVATRWGVKVYDREPGRAGANRYRAADVIDAAAKAPGKGWRASEKDTAVPRSRGDEAADTAPSTTSR